MVRHAGRAAGGAAGGGRSARVWSVTRGHGLARPAGRWRCNDRGVRRLHAGLCAGPRRRCDRSGGHFGTRACGWTRNRADRRPRGRDFISSGARPRVAAGTRRHRRPADRRSRMAAAPWRCRPQCPGGRLAAVARAPVSRAADPASRGEPAARPDPSRVGRPGNGPVARGRAADSRWDDPRPRAARPAGHRFPDRKANLAPAGPAGRSRRDGERGPRIPRPHLRRLHQRRHLQRWPTGVRRRGVSGGVRRPTVAR